MRLSAPKAAPALDVWSPRQESNLYLPLRRRPFYPLNYGERVGIVPATVAVAVVRAVATARADRQVSRRLAIRDQRAAAKNASMRAVASCVTCAL